jgi:hypothetical protein
MTKPILIYDAGCGFCKDTALKLLYGSKGRIELLALNDPQAKRILNATYPGGWKQDFYFVDGQKVRRGVGALTQIARTANISVAALVGSYSAWKVSKIRQQRAAAKHAHEHGHEHGHDHSPTHQPDVAAIQSRRKFIAAAAALPVLIPLSKLPKVDVEPSPSVFETLGGMRVHLADVTRSAAGWRANVRDMSKLVLPPVKMTEEDLKHDVAMEKGDRKLVREVQLANGGKIVIRSTKTTLRRTDGVGGEAQLVQLSSMVDTERFKVTTNVGYGPRVVDGKASYQATMSGMIEHDVALPLVDYVRVIGDAETTAREILEAQVVGVRALETFHRGLGNQRVAALYRDIANHLQHAATEFNEAIRSEMLLPAKNILTLSSSSSNLGFASVAELSAIAGGCDCDCTCACDCCCGCGCSCGCGSCGCSCSCFCCCEAGCGCGCGCCCCGQDSTGVGLGAFLVVPTEIAGSSRSVEEFLN